MKILTYPNPLLTTVCPKYEIATYNEDLAAAEQMVKLMLSHKNCDGLAANQVGIIRRFFVMRTGMGFGEIYFDPKMIKHGRDLEVKREGCMSCPGVIVQAPRWRVITVEYTSTKGVLVRETLRGHMARVFQHELDHLNGLLIVKTENDKDASLSKM